MKCKLRVNHSPLAGYLFFLFMALAFGQPASLIDLERDFTTTSGLRRRQIAREIMTYGQEAREQIIKLTRDPDMVIRRNATLQLSRVLGEDAIPLFQERLCDDSPLVRLTAVEQLMSYQPRTEAILAVLRKAVEDSDNEVRKKAASVFWVFHRDYVTLRQRPEWDHAIEIINKQVLPIKGWRFRTDPSCAGHLGKWFTSDLNASTWDPIEIGKWWNTALPDKVANYEGIAWYRISFTAPSKPTTPYNEAVLHFEAVDESTWVWINGHFAGEHDLGTTGWNIPFDIEVGSFLLWGQTNQLTVRVGNAAGAGGIYKPVELQILK
ncbi:MAG: HEAT repeat domain-containing protein [Lentisphaeria bacterium]